MSWSFYLRILYAMPGTKVRIVCSPRVGLVIGLPRSAAGVSTRAPWHPWYQAGTLGTLGTLGILVPSWHQVIHLEGFRIYNFRIYKFRIYNLEGFRI